MIFFKKFKVWLGWNFGQKWVSLWVITNGFG